MQIYKKYKNIILKKYIFKSIKISYKKNFSHNFIK